jgi:hypothetical protein
VDGKELTEAGQDIKLVRREDPKIEKAFHKSAISHADQRDVI